MDGKIEVAEQDQLASHDMDELLLRLVAAEATVYAVQHLCCMSGPTLFKASLQHALDGRP